MATVVHYVERWLELSAGFVDAHIRGSRHRGVVVSRGPFVNREAFPWRPAHTLDMLDRRAHGRLRRPALAAAVGGLAARHGARCVHAHFGYGAVDLSVLARVLPVVVSLHGHDVTAWARERPGVYRGIAARAEAVIVPSAFLADAAEAAGFPADRIHVIGAGVDTAAFPPSPLPAGPPVVSYVGRLVPKKGLDVLLAAWPAVRAAQPGATLLVLGDGPLAALLPADDPSVRWTSPDPARRQEQVRAALRAARVVVTPSRTAPDGDAESLLLVNLEAAASGRPVVTTRHGGIPDYVAEGETALLVDEGDPRALAAAIIGVLGDDELARRLGAAGPAFARRHEAATGTARIDEVYDAVLRSRRGRR